MIQESQQDVIILNHLDTVIRYVNKFSSGGLRHLKDDMISIAVYELVQRVRIMDISHPNVTAYLLKCVQSRLLDFLRREKIRSHISLDEGLTPTTEYDISLDEELEHLKLTELRKQLVWYLLQGYKQFEIAEILGVSKTTVNRHLESIRNQINEKPKS